MALRSLYGGAFLLVFLQVFCFSATGQVVAGISANGLPVELGDTVHVCQGGSILFKSVAQGSTNITWRFQNGSATTGSGLGPFSITYNTPGYDTVFQKITGGDYADSIYLIVKVSDQHPTASFSWTPNGECGNDPVQFTNTSTGSQLSNSWTFGDGGVSTETNPSYSFLNAVGISGTSSYPVNLTVVNADGCGVSIAHTVTVKNTPDASIGNADASIQFGTFNGTSTFKKCSTVPSYTFSFTNKSTTTSINTGYTIQWGDGSPDSSFSSWPSSVIIAHTFPLGSSTMTVRVSGNGCTGIKQYVVFIGSTPAGGLASLGNTDVCSSDSLRFVLSNVSTNPPGTQYTFLINDGSQPQIYTNPPPSLVGHYFNLGSCGFSSSSGNSTFLNAFGAYLTIENPCGTTSPSVVPIYVSGKPRANIYVSPSRTVCTNTPVTIESNSSYGSVITATGGTGSTCTNSGIQVWQISPSTGYTLLNGSMGSVNGNSGNGNVWTGGSTSLNVQFTSPGTYTVKLYVFNNRCGMDSSYEVICVRNPPLASFTLPKRTLCGAGDLTITNTSPMGACGGDGYQWDITHLDPKGCSSTTNTTPYTFTNGSSASVYSPSLHFSEPGQYIIQLTVSGLNAGTGCSASVFHDTITVIGTPKVNLTAPAAACPGNGIPYTARIDSCYSPGPFLYNWQFAGGSPTSASTLVPELVAYSAIGSYPYSLTVTDQYCSTTTSASGILSVVTPPVANAGNDTAVCSGSSFVAGKAATNGVSYQWHPGFGLSDSTIANPVFTAAYEPAATDTTLTYILTASLPGSCSTNDTVSITLRRKPVVNVTPSSLQVCTGDSLMLTAAGADHYSWLPSPVKSNTAGDIVWIKPTASMTGRVIGISNTGCADTLTLPVFVRPNASAFFAASSTRICNSASPGQFITVTPDTTIGTQYSWYSNSMLIGTNTTGAFPSLPPAVTAGTDTIRLTASSPYGCTADSMQIVFTTIPSVTAHFTKSIAEGCGPLSVQFTNDSSPDTSGQFFWNFGDGAGSPYAQPGTIVFPPSPYYRDTTYRITLKAFNGCDTTVWKDSILVHSPAHAAFTAANITGCSPFTDTLYNLSQGTITSYSWDFGDETTSTTTSMTNPVHVWHTGVVDTFTVVLTAVNQCGTAYDSLDIVVAPNAIRPGIQLNGNSLFGCAPFTATFLNNSSGAAQITADFGDGTTPTIIPGNQSQITHPYLNAGVYKVMMRLTNFCADTSISLSVTVYAAPTPAFTAAPNPVCTGSTIAASNLSSNSNSYHWDWGDQTSSDQDPGSHVYTQAGVYNIVLTASLVNSYGKVCQTTSQPQSVTVVDRLSAIIDTGSNKPCAPYTLQVQAPNAAAASAVYWTFYDQSRSPGTYTASGSSGSYQYNTGGSYSVRLIVQTVPGCSDTAIHAFTVHASPKLGGSPFGPLYTCNTDTTVQLSGSVSYSGSDPLSWSWQLNGQTAGAGNPFSYRFQVGDESTQPVSNVISAIVTSTSGCSDTATAGTLVIRPLPAPQISVGPDSILYQPDYTFSFRDAISRIDGMRWTWAFGDNNGETTGQQVSHTYGDTGVYVVTSLIADEASGCQKQTTTSVKIMHVPGFLFVPNAICPGCSVSEIRTFLPKGKGLKEYHLRIYNNWGQLLFETTKLDSDGSPTEAWTAQYNGQKVQQDAYRWQIEARYIDGTEWKGMLFQNASTPVKSGFITVIK